MNTRTLVALTSAAFLIATGVATAAPAADNWDNHCASCHGADGKGLTKTGKKLKLKDYTDAKVQAELKDADMVKVIDEGVMDKGKEKMKAYKAELSAGEITDLVAFIRKFKA